MSIANHLSDKALVTIYHYRLDFLQRLKKTGLYTGSYSLKIPNNINFMDKYDNSSDLCIISTPVQFIRETLERCNLSEDSDVLILSKGIERNTLSFPCEIVSDVANLSLKNIAILSGPNHAEQVVKNNPTSAVVASKNQQLSKKIQSLFSDENFRVYCSDDIIGVQLGGAVKNVISIASGIAWGLGFRENTLSSILTRGLYEIKKLGDSLGARKETLNGLAGLGDLMATSFSDDSRNRYVGIQIAKGNKIDQVLKKLNMNAEGVETSRSLYKLKSKLNIDLPICDSVYEIIFSNKDPLDTIGSLMTRKLKNEF